MRWLIPLAIALLPAATLAGGAPNLLKNGGFEQPEAPAGGFLKVTSGANLAGWTIGSQQTLALNNTGYVTKDGYTMQSHGGKQSLNLAYLGPNTQPGIFQTVQIIVGHHYRLRFWVGNIAVPRHYPPCVVESFVNGNQIITAANGGGWGTKSQDWERFEGTFTAWTTPIIVDLNAATVAGAPAQCGLDDVSLVDLDAAKP